MDRPQKATEIESISSIIGNSALVICADCRGSTSAQMTDFRRKFRTLGRAKVVKNTLAKLAVKKALASKEDKQVDKLLSTFKGPSVLLCGQDPGASAKMALEYLKLNDKFKIKGAFLDGVFWGIDGVETISTMPNREQLLGQLLNLMQSSSTNIVRVLQASAEKMVRVVEAQRKVLEEKN